MTEKSLLQLVLDSVERPEFVSRVTFDEDGGFRFNYLDKRYLIGPTKKVQYFENGQFHEDKELTSKLFD